MKQNSYIQYQRLKNQKLKPQTKKTNILPNQLKQYLNASSYKDFFVNFANKTKLNIIVALRKCPLCVNDIVKETGDEQSKISHNLKKLTKCHVLVVEKKGKQRIYSLNHNTVLPILKIVEEHIKENCRKFCKGRCDKCA
ncbi:winged helix-turn-helix transcriptional regulator [Candidatus Woesearchaeota archaeon]|nr:winged helix-turn-helix transcriptional regulator [Candidatus Woesearchaeota archaeon]